VLFLSNNKSIELPLCVVILKINNHTQTNINQKEKKKKKKRERKKRLIRLAVRDTDKRAGACVCLAVCSLSLGEFHGAYYIIPYGLRGHISLFGSSLSSTPMLQHTVSTTTRLAYRIFPILLVLLPCPLLISPIPYTMNTIHTDTHEHTHTVHRQK